LKVHRLVALAFLEPPNQELIEEMSKLSYGVVPVNHIDGNKENNHYSNLEWCSHSQNSKHAIDLGLTKVMRVVNNPLSKLSEDQIAYIRKNYIPYDSECGCRGLARRFNIHHTTISAIVRNKTYYTDD